MVKDTSELNPAEILHLKSLSTKKEDELRRIFQTYRDQLGRFGEESSFIEFVTNYTRTRRELLPLIPEVTGFIRNLKDIPVPLNLISRLDHIRENLERHECRPDFYSDLTECYDALALIAAEVERKIASAAARKPTAATTPKAGATPVPPAGKFSRGSRVEIITESELYLLDTYPDGSRTFVPSSRISSGSGGQIINGPVPTQPHGNIYWEIETDLGLLGGGERGWISESVLRLETAAAASGRTGTLPATGRSPAPSAAAPRSAPTSAATSAFKIGDRVRTEKGAFSAGFWGGIIPEESIGKIVAGPKSKAGYSAWKVKLERKRVAVWIHTRDLENLGTASPASPRPSPSEGTSPRVSKFTGTGPRWRINLAPKSLSRKRWQFWKK